MNVTSITSFKQWALLLCFMCFHMASIHAQKPQVKLFLDSACPVGFSGVVLVADNGKTTLFQAKGYRHFETKEKLRKSDIFELASVSKQFTAMIIMMLHEKGMLTYDDTIGKYVSVPYPGITIRHLLTHTSGLPDYQAIMDKYWDKSKVAGNTDIIEYLNRFAPPALFSPGNKYTYSNTGYVLLASIAEKASGRDFITMCREWIFKPLKMKDTNIRSLEEKAKVKNFAAGHLKDSTGQYRNANKFHASDYTVWLGNRKGPGRISSTAKDLLKWDKALYTEKLVKQSTMVQAFKPYKLNDGSLSNYGFGWQIGTDKAKGNYVLHTGDNPGYKTIIIRYLDRRKTVVILNNNASAAFKALENTLD